MSLINCPECGNECSSTAVACPQCGHPFVKPVVKPVAKPRVIINEVVPREESFPKWIFIPIALLGVVVLFFVFAMLRNDDADQRNINVNVASARQNERVQTNTTVSSTSSEPSTVIVPSTTYPSTVSPPQTMETPSTVTSVPSTTNPTTVTEPVDPNKSVVNIEAKILPRNGSPQPVTREKFYLLDKDLESILSEARIQDEGQGVVSAFGLSVVNPGKYSETNQKALSAIKRHIVYTTITDSTGKAAIKDVKPKNYYLFGITKTRNGFAVWSSPVIINPGQNSLVLDPVTPTEIVDFNQ